MNRVTVSKNNGILDTLVDRSLVRLPENRISWAEFKALYDQQKKLLDRQCPTQ